ncbi:MAG TPA: flagellar brake protein [bacterium]|nr:flagellar brake protein [bacterium]
MADHERVDIPEGKELLVSKKFNDPGNRNKTVVLGKKIDHFLLVELPQEDGKYLAVDKGEVCLFRFMEREVIYSFEATVLNKLTEPCPILFFDYPYRLEQFQIKEKDRASTLVPVMFSLEGEEAGAAKKADGVITQLGLGSCQIVSGKKLPENTQVGLSFRLPTDHVVKRIKWVVKLASAARSPNQFILEGDFVDLLDPAITKIDQFLELHQRIQQAVENPQVSPETSTAGKKG